MCDAPSLPPIDWQARSGSFSSIDPADAFAALYGWLRYSATRHLTWQRHYNTQPRILSGAQVGLG